MSQVVITETFKDANDIPIDPTSVKLSSVAGTYGVKRNDTDAVIVADGVDMIKSVVGTYSYTFDEPAGADGLIYTYVVEWTYNGHTDYDERLVAGESSGLSILNNKTKYINWIKQEFQPRTLAIPDETIEQIIDNSVRYWNTHSAYKISQMVVGNGTVRNQLSPSFKSVTVVHPNSSANWIWNEFPTWSLAGIAVLDNVRTDLILATEAFKTFNIYVGANFRYYFEPNIDNPNVGGFLYTKNVPQGATAFYCEGTMRILPTDDIKSQPINDWLLGHMKALVKKAEGHAIRAAQIVVPGIDGQVLYNEGKEEEAKSKETLAKESRWVAFIKRQ